MTILGYYTFRITVFLFSLVPFKVLYVLSDILSLLFYHVIKYRKTMIMENLTKSFPELSRKEIDKICKDSYANLSDILLEGIKGLSLNAEDILKRYQVLPNQNLDKFHENGQSVIGLTAHLTNWEWGVASCGLSLKHHVLGVYKKLSHPLINKYIFKTRDRINVTLSEMQETMIILESDHKLDPFMLMLITDQRPTDPLKAHWTKFLNRDTAFFYGAEKIALDYNYPLFYFNIRRVKRGYYEVDVVDVCNDPSGTKKGEITEIYKNLLEAEVKKRPSDWLWSHSRWKHPKPKDTTLN